MADGGVDFAIRLNNQVTGPARQIKASMAMVQKAFEQTRKVVDAPASRRGGASDWNKMVGKARGSQAVDFAKQQVKAAKFAASAKIKEEKRVQDFHKGMAQASLDKQGGLVDFATGGLKYGMIAVGTAALAAAAGVAYLGAKFTMAAVEAGAFAERSRLALGLLTGDAALGAVEFDSMRKEAASLGLAVEDTQLNFQKLLAAQFSIGKSKELIRMGSDMQAIGASTEQVSRSILAISQIKNTGYLQGDELNQLREAGVSTELIYKSLGKSLNKTTAEIVQMQEKRQLKSEPVIEAILDAVRQKTGSSKAGDAGTKFAQTSLTGMANVMRGNAENFFIDVGDAMVPGLQRLMALVKRAVGVVADDPKFAQLGEFMLAKFEGFVSWVEGNWPQISTMLTTGLDAFKFGLETAFEMVDMSTIKGKVFMGAMGLLAVTLGIVALAGFVMMLPLYALIAVIGLVAYGIYKAVAWIADVISSLSFGSVDFGGATAVSGYGQAVPGLSGLMDAPQITTAADSGLSARLPSMLSSLGTESVTVAAEPQGVAGSKTINMNGWNVGSGINQEELMAKVRSTVHKELEEAS